MRNLGRWVRAAAFAAGAAFVLTACRQDQILNEAAKFEQLQKDLHDTAAPLVVAPVQMCERRHARGLLAQPLTPIVVDQRITQQGPTGNCALNTDFAQALTASTTVLDKYAGALVLAGKGQKIPDPKVGSAIATLRKVIPGGIVPGLSIADIDLVVKGLEQLLDRNLRANQVRHIAHEVDKPLKNITEKLVTIFDATGNCALGAGTWCSVFAPETQDLKDVWGPLAESMRTSVPLERRVATAPHPPEYFTAQWEVRKRFEDDVNAHEAAIALGPAFASALKAFQREHAALIAVIDARSPDNTALFDR